MTLVPVQTDVATPELVQARDADIVAATTLEELAAIANAENDMAEVAIGSLRDVFRTAAYHAIRAGEALLKAKDLVEPGAWINWQTDNLTFARSTANRYMRIAAYRDDIDIWLADGGNGTIQGAWKFLMPMPGLHAKNVKRPDLQAEAIRLHKQGMTVQSVAQSLGVGWVTVKEWVDPAYSKARSASRRQRRAERKEAEKVLAQKERERAVRQRGGSAADAYALLRRALQRLDVALADAVGDEEREQLRSAMAYAHKAEDEIVRAIRGAQS